MAPLPDQLTLVGAGDIWFSALNRHWYLLSEIIRPLVAVLAILVLLFAGYSLAGILSNAVSGLLPLGAAAALTSLKVLIALEVLIPISLFIAVVVGFGRMQADSEVTAMFSLGIGPKQFLTPVMSLALGLALIVSALSLFARPWAYKTAYQISFRAAATLNVNAMEAGTFYASQDGNQVIFLGQRAGPNTPAHNVFVARHLGEETVVVSAASATPSSIQPDGQRSIGLQGVRMYRFNQDNPARNQFLHASELTMTPGNTSATPPGYTPVAASTVHLLTSNSPPDVAERQWRFSTGLSTLLLAILGAVLSRSRPRQSRYTRFGPAILAYAAYYLLCTSARTWVEHGNIGTFPGIWWAPALLAFSILCLWHGPTWARYIRHSTKPSSHAMPAPPHKDA